jgi:hypothetical protein
VVPFGAEPYIDKSIMIKNDLKISDAYKDDPEYNQAKADLDNDIKQYKIKGYGCHNRAAQAGINCAIRSRIKYFVKLVTPLARHMVKSLCQGNSMIIRDHWNVPVERRKMARIIALLDQEHKKIQNYSTTTLAHHAMWWRKHSSPNTKKHLHFYDSATHHPSLQHLRT